MKENFHLVTIYNFRPIALTLSHRQSPRPTAHICMLKFTAENTGGSDDVMVSV